MHYARVVKDKINRQWRYPPKAREDLLEGRLTVNFSLRRDGQVIQVRIIEPSGYVILDREAVRAVSSAAPFPSFPEQVTVRRLNINATFDYRLTRKGSSGK
jgi:protein TonB